MAQYVGQRVQINKAFNDRSFTVNANETGMVKNISQQTGNVQVDFGNARLVTFLPNELQEWLRPVQAQAAYGQSAQPAYGQAAAQPAYGQAVYRPPASNNPYGAQAQPAYVQQPAYVAAQQPAYVAPPVAAGPAYGVPQPAYQAAAQPVYQPPQPKPQVYAAQPMYQLPKPQPQVYQPPVYAPPPINAAQVADNAVDEYKRELESKERALSLPMTGILDVRVGGCKKLPSMDTFGGCDPYVKVMYDQTTVRTRKMNTKNPEFNQSFSLPIEQEKYLIIEVWDFNAVGSDDRIFVLPLPFHGMIQYGFKQRHEFALSEKARITLDLTYTPKEDSDFKEREDVVVQFTRKPFGLELVPGPNNTGAKVTGFTKDAASRGGAQLGMYVTMVNGISTIGTRYKFVMKLLEKARKNSIVNFADLRVGSHQDNVSI